MSNGDDYVKVELTLVFATVDAVRTDDEVWIPRSVLFGPHESDIGTGHLDGEERILKVREWFAKKADLKII